MWIVDNVICQIDNVQPLALPIYNIVISTVILLSLLFLGAIAAGAEVALFTLQSKEVNYLKTRSDNASIQIVQLIEQPATLMSSLKSTKKVAAVVISLCLYYLADILLSDYLQKWVLIVLVIVISLVIIILILEVIPKVYARQNNLRLAMFSAPIVTGMYRLFKNFVPSAEQNESENEIKIKKSNALNEEELTEAVTLRLGHAPSKEELDIFKGIIRFGEVTVRQIMQPRMHISGVREEWNLQQVREKISRARYSRMPVYKETIDHIIGIIYTKELIKYMEASDADWHVHIQPAFYIHEGKLIEDLFQEFQNKRVHVAIVVDEFGGTSGMVTLEDIMEEVVGEIRDEFDEDVMNFKKIDADTYIFDGRTLINDMCRIINADFDIFENYKGESSSVAGLVLELAKKFPDIDETFHIEQYAFTVLALEEHRIERVKVKING